MLNCVITNSRKEVGINYKSFMEILSLKSNLIISDRPYSTTINSHFSYNIYTLVMQKNQIFTKTILVAQKRNEEMKYITYLC